MTQKTIKTHKHPFHLVDPSPWPIIAAMSCFFFAIGLTLLFHGYKGSMLMFWTGLISILFVMYAWWRDVVREATYEGHHTHLVQRGLRIGMILFILSEVMFFFGFFWAFYHSSLAPAPDIGSIWPPDGLNRYSPWEVHGLPLFSTGWLLTSGATITWAHHALISGRRKRTNLALMATIFCAFWFFGLQLSEYLEAFFTMADSIYGSLFYMTTGFHGLHVIVGLIFIIVCTVRLNLYHLTRQRHFGFEAAAWYWHFVDVVWLFLFISLYWWGGN